ncbi:MAG: helix-turn-helix domain-containing protein [Pseudomonadota bacterium]
MRHKVNLTKRAYTPEQVEATWGIPKGTLANWRYQKLGPRYYVRGRRIYYFFDDVEGWLRQNPVLTRNSLDEIAGRPS